MVSLAFSIVLGVALVLYVFFFLLFIFGWSSLRGCSGSSRLPEKQVSVVIVARNEEAHIGALLSDLSKQRYPKACTEIIVVNDCSTDNTAAAVLPYIGERVRLLQLEDYVDVVHFKGSFKKMAIQVAVQQARGEWIARVDADCRVGPHWLSTLMCCQQARQAVMVCGPVNFSHDGSLMQQLIALDNLGLMGIGGATLAMGMPTICNGANMLFSRRAFLEAGGYTSNLHRASGDDVFLLHALFKNSGGRVVFCRDKAAEVITGVANSWTEVLEQRRRWASKLDAVRNIPLVLMAATVLVFNLFLFIAAAGLMWTQEHLFVFLLAGVTKWILDVTFLTQVTRFAGQWRLLRLFLIGELLHGVLVMWVGLTAWKKSITWKGRPIS
ncbi:MAG: glycosyltransferase [Chitinophagales bacterium]|nr:glycosyltransferase [Chitinophagales bacterium]MDW8428038.1 glycosyltransferase [Chitinophagales bacterium]